MRSARGGALGLLVADAFAFGGAAEHGLEPAGENQLIVDFARHQLTRDAEQAPAHDFHTI